MFAEVYPLVTARAVARSFTYEVEPDVGVGAIVRVPFGRSRARGIVTAVVDLVCELAREHAGRHEREDRCVRHYEAASSAWAVRSRRHESVRAIR